MGFLLRSLLHHLLRLSDGLRALLEGVHTVKQGRQGINQSLYGDLALGGARHGADVVKQQRDGGERSSDRRGRSAAEGGGFAVGGAELIAVAGFMVFGFSPDIPVITKGAVVFGVFGQGQKHKRNQ